MKAKRIMALLMGLIMALGVWTVSACKQNPEGGGQDGTPKVHAIALKYDGKVIGDSLTVALGTGSITLTAELTKDEGASAAVIWTSSDEQVATVANGAVTLKKTGETEIAALAGEAVAKFTLTVQDGDVPPPAGDPAVHSVTIKQGGQVVTQYTAYLEDGTVSFTAEVVADDGADKSVAWSSNDQTIATVSNQGTITLKAVGSTQIKATAGDKSAEVALVVANKSAPPVKEPEVLSVAIKYSGSVVESEQTVDLSAGSIHLDLEVSAEEGADYTAEWTSEVETVATVSGDTNGADVTIAGAGETTISVTAGGKSKSFVLHVNDDSAPRTFNITVTDGVAKNARGDTVSTAEVGEQITLEATIPTHKTFTSWNIQSDEAVSLSGNQFTMPASDVTAAAQFTDTLYTLTVVGGTVSKAGEATDPQGVEEGDTPQTKSTTYQFAYGTQVTIKPVTVSGKWFIDWDYMAADNRVNALGASEYTFSMGDDDETKYTAVYSSYNNSVWANKDISTGSSPWIQSYSKTSMDGLSGYKLNIKGDGEGVTGFSENIQGSSIDTNKNGRGFMKVVFQNNSDKYAVTVETYSTFHGIKSTSGEVTVQPGEKVEKCFVLEMGFGSSPYCGIDLRKNVGGSSSETVELIVVAGWVNKLYENGDPYLNGGGANGVKLVDTKVNGAGWGVMMWENMQTPKLPLDAALLANGNLLWCVKAQFIDPGKGVWRQFRIDNMPAYAEGTSVTSIYARFINVINDTEEFTSAYKVVISKSATSPSEDVVGEYSFSFETVGQVVTAKIDVQRSADEGTLYLYIVKETQEQNDLLHRYGYLMNLAYNNVYGYQED